MLREVRYHKVAIVELSCDVTRSIIFFTITVEIQARSLANIYCQYADRDMNLNFLRRVSEREPAIRQFVIVKNKLTSVLMRLSCY